MNTNAIIDNKGREIKESTYGKAVIKPGSFFNEEQKLNIEYYCNWILWVLAAVFSFWITISLFSDKSFMPAIYILVTFQAFFFIG